MIQNIIITHESGIPLFARSLMCHIGMHCVDLSKDSTFADETLLHSALYNAMLIYDQAHPNQFHEFKMEKSKTLTFPSEKITAIMNTDPEDDFEAYKNRLRLFSDLFMKHYGHLVDDFDGDITKFSLFQEIIAEEGLLDEGERFRKNCVECEYDKACIYRISIGPTNRTLKERFDAIIEISWIQKLILIMKGMFQPKYLRLEMELLKMSER